MNETCWLVAIVFLYSISILVSIVLMMFVIGFVVGCCIGANDGLHGVIRWFKFILGVFLISCKCEWNLLISNNCVELVVIVFKFCTCELFDMDNGVDYDM